MMEFHRRLAVLWIALVVLSGSSVSSKAESCEEGTGDCQRQESRAENSAPTQALSFTHKMTQHISGARAVDVVLIVSAAHTLKDYHSWLQITVPYLDVKLRALNIGIERLSPNRYAVVQFGGRGIYSMARFLTVGGKIFFPSSSFGDARRQLQRRGVAADGYHAIEYALRNAPFRNDSGIAKMMLLVANKGRNNLVTRSDLTKGNISRLLKDNDILFHALVATSLSVTTPTGNISVFGVSGYNKGIVPGRNGTHNIVVGKAVPSSSAYSSRLFRDYVTLALDSGGVACSLDQLIQENVTVLGSFLGVVTTGYSLHSLRKVDVCEKCRCAGVGGTKCGPMACEVATNQSLCACLVQHSLAHCNGSEESPNIITPALHAPLPTSTAQGQIVLRVVGTASVFPGGDVEVAFSSNKNRASYDCVLLDGSTPTPEIRSCTSPFYAKNIAEGKHKVLVIAKRKGFYGSRVFDFDIRSDQPKKWLEISLRDDSNPANRSVTVRMTVKNPEVLNDGEVVSFMCSTGGNTFFACSSPYYVPSSEIPVGQGGLLFVAVAFTGNRPAAIATKVLKKPVIPTGPVMIHVLSPQPPDPLGRITIRFSTSRLDVRCICRVNMSHQDCTNQYIADPRKLGAGTHNLSIVCMDYSGFIDTQHFKLTLLPPPQPQVSGPIRCNMTLSGMTDSGKIMALFGCDRKIFATCQVSGMAAEPCNTPYGMYQIDVRRLSRGPHLFILNVDDGFGRTLMKVHPFSLGTAHRRCCPILDDQLSSLTRLDNLTNVLLDLRVLAGNCSENEGFSYAIDWGNSAIQTGSTVKVSTIVAPYFYPTSSQNDTISSSGLNGNHRTVKVSYCNDPVSLANRCCDTLTFPIQV